MKKYFLKLSVLAALGLGLHACSDQLEVPPNSDLIDITAFQTVDDVQQSLNAAYNDYNINSFITLNSIFTDNTKVGVDNGGQQLGLHGLVMDASTGIANTIWSGTAGMINNTNIAIAAADFISFDASEQARVDHIRGQAYALRAFGHFTMFQYFTPDYLAANGLAVPILDVVVNNQNVARSSVSEVLAFIEQDLTTAEGLLDPAQADNRFVTADFIKGLRARVALFSGDYPAADGFAGQLIADYPLADRAQYAAMYQDMDNTEVIWKFGKVLGDARPGFIWHFSGGGPFIEMSNSFFDELDAADVRFGVNLNEADSDPALNSHLINKYPGGALEFLNDVKAMRVSEMYLIRAEAQARAGQLGDAANTIKAIRDARFGSATTAPSYGNLDAALQGILDERRIELSYEGHRWLDLKRLNFDLVRDAVDCSSLSNACMMDKNDQRFTLPIPSGELNANDLMEQNPGY